MLLVLGILLFIGLVIVHELGHFWAARKSGVEVEEFGIGFPPKVWGKRLKSGMLFSINLLPLGGFVRLKGESDSATGDGAYGQARLRNKIWIMVMGVVMNLITAFLLLTILALSGLPKLIPDQFTVKSNEKIINSKVVATYIEEGGPLQKSNVKVGDEIRFIAPINDVDACKVVECGYSLKVLDPNKPNEAIKPLVEKLVMQGNNELIFGVVKDGKEIVEEVRVTPRSVKEIEDSKNTENPKGYVGILAENFVVKRYTWSAPVVAAGTMVQYTKATLSALGGSVTSLFKGDYKEAGQNISGPVGIFGVLQISAVFGVSYVLFIIAVISLSLAIMNILPIPALDGGRLYLTLIFRFIKKPLTEKIETRINAVGFVALMLLFVVMTIVDIKRIT